MQKDSLAMKIYKRVTKANIAMIAGIAIGTIVGAIIGGLGRWWYERIVGDIYGSIRMDIYKAMESTSGRSIDAHKNIALEYEQINENFRFLADVRFKLLALIPILGGTAIFVLSQIGLQAGVQTVESVPTLVVVAFVSVFGFLATLGITIYDQRNSELYNALIHRAKYLEGSFGSPSAPGGLTKISAGGQFRERPSKNRRLLFEVGHDLGLALIYGPLLGAWFFPCTYAIARIIEVQVTYAQYVAIGIALFFSIIFMATLLQLDSADKELYHKAAIRDGIASEK